MATTPCTKGSAVTAGAKREFYPYTTRGNDNADDGDVPRPVATALAFLRARVPSNSLALLSTRGNSLDSLGVRDIMKEVIGALTGARGRPRPGTPGAVALAALARCHAGSSRSRPRASPQPRRCRSGRVASSRVTSSCCGTRTSGRTGYRRWSHTRSMQEGKSERERGEELVAFIQDAARKRRLGQAVSRMMDVPSVPPGDLAHARPAAQAPLCRRDDGGARHDAPLAGRARDGPAGDRDASPRRGPPRRGASQGARPEVAASTRGGALQEAARGHGPAHRALQALLRGA